MWGDLGKLIVAKGFKKLPKVQYIAQSGHTALHSEFAAISTRRLLFCMEKFPVNAVPPQSTVTVAATCN